MNTELFQEIREYTMTVDAIIYEDWGVSRLWVGISSIDSPRSFYLQMTSSKQPRIFEAVEIKLTSNYKNEIYDIRNLILP